MLLDLNAEFLEKEKAKDLKKKNVWCETDNKNK